MSTNLRATIDTLAKTFANSVLAAIRAGTLDDILAETTGAPRRASSPIASVAGAAKPAPAKSAARRPSARRIPGRLPRRSAADIGKTLDQIVGLVKKKPGLRAEQIRVELALDVRELPRVLKEGLDKKRLSKKGEKRATEYFAK